MSPLAPETCPLAPKTGAEVQLRDSIEEVSFIAARRDKDICCCVLHASSRNATEKLAVQERSDRAATTVVVWFLHANSSTGRHMGESAGLLRFHSHSPLLNAITVQAVTASGSTTAHSRSY